MEYTQGVAVMKHFQKARLGQRNTVKVLRYVKDDEEGLAIVRAAFAEVMEVSAEIDRILDEKQGKA